MQMAPEALTKWYDDLKDGIEYRPLIPPSAMELLADIRDNNGRAYFGPDGSNGPEYYFEEVV